MLTPKRAEWVTSATVAHIFRVEVLPLPLYLLTDPENIPEIPSVATCSLCHFRGRNSRGQAKHFEKQRLCRTQLHRRRRAEVKATEPAGDPRQMPVQRGEGNRASR